MNCRIAAPASHGRRAARERGQSMIEYLIIFPSLLLLVLGAVQFGLLYQIKSQVNYATFQAARQGALKNASMNSMKDAFGAGMTPIFTPEPNMTGMARGRLVGALEAFNPLVTSIKQVSPVIADVKNDSTVRVQDPDDTSKWMIPNDNLQYRPTTVGSSGLNVQDANILKIQVTYCAKLIVPLANVVFYSLVNGIQGVRNLAGQQYNTGELASTPNTCSQLKDRAGPALNTVGEIAGEFGIDTGPINEIIVGLSDALSGFAIPGLNWVVGGYRIPVTAEAVVRMQTPIKFAK